MMKLNIAVIDDGIQPDILESLTNTKKNVECLQILRENCVAQYTDPLEIVNHGTLCTALLIECLEKQKILNLVNITSISIANFKNEQTIDALLTSLNWCADHEVDLALMSIGLVSYFCTNELLPVVERVKVHTTMVAATANDYSITYPACFRDVIGVKSIQSIDKTSNIINVIKSPCDGVEIEAHISKSYVLNNCESLYSVKYPKSNSIMVPFVASELSRILLEKGNLEKNLLLRELSSNHQVKKNQLINVKQRGDIPVILAKYRLEYKYNIKNIINLLILKFMEKGYSCACILDLCYESNFEKSIYYLPDFRECTWMDYYTVALAYNSFILVVVAEDNSSLNDFEPDLVLTSKTTDIICTEKFIEVLYNIVIS